MSVTVGGSYSQRREGKEKMPEMGSPECLFEEANSAEKTGGNETEN